MLTYCIIYFVDVFSFAVVLWEIFTGRSPSEGVTDLRGYMFDVVVSVSPSHDSLLVFQSSL